MGALRWYQQEAVEAVYEAMARGVRRPAIVAPTGSGKSRIIGQLCADAASDGVPALVLAHRKELIEQNVAELLQVQPLLRAGVYSAGAGGKDLGRQVTYAGIQSLARARTLPHWGLVIVDEAHMIGRKEATQYQQTLARIREANPALVTVGLTATPWRMDSGYLVEGDDAPFDDIVYRIGMRTLLDEGHLAPVTARGGSRKIDLGAIKVVRGEFDGAAMEAACVDVLDAVVADVCEALAAGRRAAIVFAASRVTAADLGERFRAAGVTCGVVDDFTGAGERAGIVEAVRTGGLQVVCNVGVLTTGFNAPLIDVVAIVRATMSTSLYVQIVGRGMRPAEGKADCLLLDYGGNVLRHGPVDAPRPIFAGAGGTGEAPQKECLTCKLLVATSTRFCPECGHEWERKEAALMARYEGDVLASPEYVEGWRTVDVVNLKRHRKAGAPDSLRVDFACGLEIYSRWVCPEHPGRPRIWYESWCYESGVPVCATVDEALTYPPTVARIRVRKDGKHWLVVRQERA